MIRLLVFALLFPAFATATFYAVNYILTGAAQDGGGGPVFIYLTLIVPGLMVALLDWRVAKSPVPGFATTTALTYALSVLFLALLLGAIKPTVALGLIGAIPAGMCSWLSSRGDDSTQASSPHAS